jgi:alkylation response protein AidB-like acyl-CoA dehydrogenase
MTLAFSEEQEALRENVRRFLQDKATESEVRRLMATEEGYDESVWKFMADALGLQSLAIPEEFGGQGFGLVEQYIVFEEMGAALFGGPFFATVALAAGALIESDDDAAKASYLPGIASGDTIATLAYQDDSGSFDLDKTSTKASADGDAWKISGAKNYVVDGNNASLILVTAETDKGLSLFAVDGDATGLSRTNLPTLDQTRKQSRLEFTNTPARLIGTDGGADAWLTVALQKACVLLSAEEAGGADKVLAAAVEYAKNRVQFDRPIASFQAIKHMCADMMVEVESAKSLASYAAWAGEESTDELAVMSSTAKSYCSEAFFHCASQNIQIHGGIGYTWEHPAHLYFKRAKSSEIMLGDPSYHRELLLEGLGV